MMAETTLLRPCVWIFAFGLLVSGHAAAADDPRLAPGRDPSGTAVAVLSSGIDYTRADVARVLARDGEGEAIAWDALDGDRRPFSRDGDGTALVLAATALGGVRIVPVRMAAKDPASLAQAAAFAAQTPAQIVIVALTGGDRTGGDRTGRDVIVAAARRFEARVFVVSMPGLTEEDRKLAETVPNLILLDPGPDGMAAADAVAHVVGCGRGALSGLGAAERARAFLGRRRLPVGPAGETAPANCDQSGDGKSEQPQR